MGRSGELYGCRVGINDFDGDVVDVVVAIVVDHPRPEGYVVWFWVGEGRMDRWDESLRSEG